MENRNKNHAYFLNLNPEEIPSAFRLFRRLDIYSFNERLEKILTGKDKLDFDQVKGIYQGDSVPVKEVKSGGQILYNRILSYDRVKDRFAVTQSQKQENKLSALQKPLLYPKQGRKM